MPFNTGTTWAQLVVKVRHDRVQPLNQISGTSSTHQRISSFGSRTHPLTTAWRTIRTLGTVLSNSLLSAAIAWLLAFCIGQGNIFSSMTSKEQPHAVFLTAKMVWFWVFAWLFTIAECVAKLLPETFISPSSSTPSKLPATKIIVKLARAMFVHIVVVSAMSIGVGIAVASNHLAHDKFKADVYWPMMCYNFILTVTDAHTRHIFRVETVNGKTRARRPSRHTNQPQPLTITPRRTPSAAHFVRVFVQNLALVMSGLAAGAFVHVASSIEMKEKWELVLFAMCSQTSKLLIQATAKLYLGRRKKTPSMRTMAIIVSAPTILVDTQLRTVLLCLDSTSTTLTGSVLLAMAKTGLRLLTALHMRHQTRKILIKYPPPSVALLPQDSAVRTHPVQSLLAAGGSLSAPELEGIARVQKLTALHAAEVYADMHGEYIAMCCAYVIIICFGSNPRFVLGGNTSTKSTHEIELSTILVQMGIEVIVDIIAIPLEIRFGVKFEKFQTDDTFLAIFMVLVAVVSIHIASGVYMKVH